MSSGSNRRFHPYSQSQTNANANKSDNSSNKTKPTTSKNANNDRALANITNTSAASSNNSLLKKTSNNTSKAKLFNPDVDLGDYDDYENQEYYSNFNKSAQSLFIFFSYFWKS